MYVIVNADSWDDADGPHEVFDSAYDGVDKSDHVAMLKLADSLGRNYDGNYAVRTEAEVAARRDDNT